MRAILAARRAATFIVLGDFNAPEDELLALRTGGQMEDAVYVGWSWVAGLLYTYSCPRDS